MTWLLKAEVGRLEVGTMETETVKQMKKACASKQAGACRLESGLST